MRHITNNSEVAPQLVLHFMHHGSRSGIAVTMIIGGCMSGTLSRAMAYVCYSLCVCQLLCTPQISFCRPVLRLPPDAAFFEAIFWGSTLQNLTTRQPLHVSIGESSPRGKCHVPVAHAESSESQQQRSPKRDVRC